MTLVKRVQDLRQGRVCLGLAGLTASLLMVGAAGAQQTPLAFNENVVYLDAAHGGTDPGAHLGGTVEEKDVSLALTGRVKAALAAKGFIVVSSRDGDGTATAEQRAGVANHVRPVACILLHASASGSGVTLAVSALTPDGVQRQAVPWGSAQAGYISQSLALRAMMATSLTGAKIKQVVVRASTPPIDSLMCAAVTVELGPLEGSGAGDAEYQQKVAGAVAEAAQAWKGQVAPAKAAPTEPGAAPKSGNQPTPGGGR